MFQNLLSELSASAERKSGTPKQCVDKVKTVATLCKPCLQATPFLAVTAEGKDMRPSPLGMSGKSYPG